MKRYYTIYTGTQEEMEKINESLINMGIVEKCYFLDRVVGTFGCECKLTKNEYKVLSTKNFCSISEGRV